MAQRRLRLRVVNETGHPDDAAELIWEIIQAEARREPPRRPRV